MASMKDVLDELKRRARPEHVQGMASYGITPERRLGVSVPDMRRIARAVGKDHELALRLWKTGIPEARIVAAMIDRPEDLTEHQMNEWVAGFDSWDVCDQVCMNLFRKSPLAWKKIDEWSRREQEYVRRAAYALIACLAWHERETRNEKFIGLFPVIRRGATDERNYVKKAVSWALRNIGKRNRRLNRAALEAAEEIGRLNSRAARWIASDARRELSSQAVQNRLVS